MTTTKRHKVFRRLKESPVRYSVPIAEGNHVLLRLFENNRDWVFHAWTDAKGNPLTDVATEQTSRARDVDEEPEADETEDESADEPTNAVGDGDIAQLIERGLDQRAVDALRDGGFDTIEQVAVATDLELNQVNGVGSVTIQTIRRILKEGHA